jgi:hypothetical protein
MYIPIIKTGEAEIRAMSKLSPSMLKFMRPIIELTRGRLKTMTEGEKKIISYPFSNRLTQIKEYLKGQTVFLDLTTDESLLSNEVYQLYEPNNGYENWRSFVNNNIGEDGFSKIIPAILFNWDDVEFDSNFSKQVELLGNNHQEVMYRSSIQTKDCYDELPMILNYLPKECVLWIILDGGYLQDAAVDLAYERCMKRIQNIQNNILKDRNAHFVVAATSYPERAHDYGDGNPILITNAEVKLHEKLKTCFRSLHYGDYAGINPIRKDLVVMARGWIPKIDIPLVHKTKVYWRRRAKGTTEYKTTYIMVAEDVVNDPEFPIQLREQWGINEIVRCADGDVPSSAPGFWISVRMYNHMYQQLIRLGHIK